MQETRTQAAQPPVRSRRSFLRFAYRSAGAGITAIALAACGRSGGSTTSEDTGVPPPPATPQLRWVTDHGRGRRGEASEFAAELFKELHPEIELLFEPVPEVADRLSADMAAGSSPDVFLSSDDLMIPFGQAVLDLTPLYDADDEISTDDFMPIPPSFVQEGKILAVPYQGNVQGMWINVDLFEQAGLPMPWAYNHDGDKWWDWNDFLESARGISSLNDEIYGFQLVNRFEWGYLSWVLSNGGFWVDEGAGARIAAFIDPDTRTGAFRAPATAEAMQFCVDMICAHGAAMPFEKIEEIRDSMDAAPFAVGLAGMAEATNEGAVKASGLNIVRVAFPRSPVTGAAHTGLNNQPHQIGKDTRFPDEAWTFAKFMAGHAIQWKAAVELGGFDPSRRDIYADPAYYTDFPDVSREAKLEQIDQGGYRPMFNRFWEWAGAFHEIMARVGGCEMEIGQGMEELDQMTTAFLQQDG